MKIGKYAVIVLSVFFVLVVNALGQPGEGVVGFESEVVKLAGDFKFTEGPAVDKNGDIYFTDIPNNRIHKWSVKDGKLSIFMENTGGANGLYFDENGNLLACAGGAGKLLSISPKGKVTVLADKYKGKSFNSPNDLWIDPKGGIYFTDPRYGRRDNLPQDGEHVYYLSAGRKKIVRVIDDMVRPNGVIGTADGKILYVADRGANKTYSYKINADGTLTAKKLFAEKGSDGMTLDEMGNLYITVDGVLVYDPSGKLINKIEVPETPANVCFGKDKKTLFITARKSFYCVKRAATKAAWRFVSMPDFLNVDTDYPQVGWEDSISYILKSVKAEEPDFLVVAGDLVMGEWHNYDKARLGVAGIRHYAERYYPAWKERLDAHGLKWYAGIGDHELGDNAWFYKGATEMVAEYKKQFREHLGMPLNGPEGMKGTAFWWRHKNVVFVSVDLFEKGKSRQGVIRTGVTGGQLEWLKDVLKKNEDADHKIVMGHAPCLGPVRKWSSSGLMVEEGRKSEFWQAMAGHGVDLYLCGEVHAITCTERDGVQQVAHGGLIGYNTRTNYMVVDVYGDRLELTIKEIDMVPSGKKLWQPGNNRPLEKVDITPEIRKRGFVPVGKLTVNKSGGKKVFEKPQGYFLKKFETSTEVARPVFWKKDPRPLPRINLDGTVEAAGAALVKKKDKPNLIVILTDDQGYGDVGCYGAKGFKTPVLDRMADEGVRFTSFYAAPWCSPSRASFMTGCHYQRVGVTCPINRPELGLAGSEITIAEHLKAAGYATGLIGKWHLGLHESMNPIAQGFDYFSGIPLSHIRYGKNEHTDGPTAYYRRQWRKMEVGKKDQVEFGPDEVLFTQRITEESLDFIKANKDKPFFLFISHAQVHYEVLASKGFKGKSRKGVWGDAIQELDWSVGEVLKALRKLGIDKDTLVVFVSDNGPQHKDGSARPLSGRKGQTLEGGLRVPCIMRWPGRIGEGIVCDETASIMDIFPTFARVIGTEMPGDRLIDGKDIWPLMTVKGAKTPHDAYYYYRGDFGRFQAGDDTSATLSGVRSGSWKLHLGRNGKWSLCNLLADVEETTDVSKQCPEIRLRLEKLLDKARVDLGDKGLRGAGVRRLGKVSTEEARRVGRVYRGE